jgi:tRNA-splicing ligase RtcB
VAQDEHFMPTGYDISSLKIVSEEYKSAKTQIGTLGGGNHFIELQRDEDGYLWVMIHSGSRNLGKKVCDYYDKIAISLNELWHSEVKSSLRLAFLPKGTPEYDAYWAEMNYCVDFALCNRRLMMERIKDVLANALPGIEFEPMINIAHNYAAIEHHFGHDVIVHRKGATLAREGVTGIIPGSQGTASYIVEGLGNPESFCSCSHGSGRLMSRTKAVQTLSLEDEIKRLDEQGIVHAIRTEKDLEEAAGAYKDIEEVINNELDLVKIKTRFLPVAVVKG